MAVHGFFQNRDALSGAQYVGGGSSFRFDRTGSATANRKDVYIGPIRLAVADKPSPPAQKNDLKIVLKLIDQGKIDEAITRLEKMVTEEPNHAFACFYLGYLYFQKGRLPESLVQLRHANELDTSVPRLTETLAEVLSQIGKTAEAIGLLEEAYRKNPSRPDFLLKKFGLELKEGHLEAATTGLVDLIAKRPNDSQAHRMLGLAYYQKGDKGAARNEWEQALKLDPKDTKTAL